MTKNEILEKYINEAKEFEKRNITSSDPDFKSWNNSLLRFVEKKYGKNSKTYDDFSKRTYSLSFFFGDTPESEHINAYKDDMSITRRDLEKLLEEEKMFNDELNVSDIKKNNKSKKVFIVHGRDDSKKYEVKGFLHELGLEPIILHQQVNGGKTIIEKIEKNSDDIACAIVLFTPDDIGKLKDSDEELRTRARQNVIFEAGYFMGKIGRNRTIILSGVEEKMTDIDGIVYIDINNYQDALMREFKELSLIK